MKESRQSIRQLSALLVNRIAAGEVIERPASVVKELVENAIDAGAKHIIVEVEDGGRELIRIIDDGNGILPSELPLAFASHATSKLLTDDDLYEIRTMGFRGEALASIGAVSHARILSRVRDEQSAYEIFNRGGAISDPQAAAGNVGTVVEIRNLFFNTPARRKFMKGAGTEFGHITDQVLRTALAHPTISFSLSHNARVSLELPACDETSRWLEAWPKEFRDARLSVDANDAEIRIRGIIGMPELARPVAKYQHVFLNGRPIRDRYIIHALREAYRGLTEPGRHPAAVVMLDIPPADVDVNVHPTKIEVRFKDSGRIHGLVLSAVREKLLSNDLTPAAIPMQSDAGDAAREDLKTRLASFFRGEFEQAMTTPPSPSILGEGRGEGFGGNDERGTLNEERKRPSPLPSPGVPGEGVISSTTSPAIQLHNAYLVAQSEDGLVIIDQHALHERIMFEELIARIRRGPLESQRLLIPLSVPASNRQLALLEQIQPLLMKLGIEVSPFGPNTVAVQSFPSFLEKLDPAEFVRELLEKGEQELLDLHEEELLHGILDMMACQAAVKAGDPLTSAEIQALLSRRELVERSSNCPHGRPTTLRLTLRDLEKQFKRTGF